MLSGEATMTEVRDRLWDGLEDAMCGPWCNEHRGLCGKLQRRAVEALVPTVAAMLDEAEKRGEARGRAEGAEDVARSYVERWAQELPQALDRAKRQARDEVKLEVERFLLAAGHLAALRDLRPVVGSNLAAARHAPSAAAEPPGHRVAWVGKNAVVVADDGPLPFATREDLLEAWDAAWGGTGKQEGTSVAPGRPGEAGEAAEGPFSGPCVEVRPGHMEHVCEWGKPTCSCGVVKLG